MNSLNLNFDEINEDIQNHLALNTRDIFDKQTDKKFYIVKDENYYKEIENHYKRRKENIPCIGKSMELESFFIYIRGIMPKNYKEILISMVDGNFPQGCYKLDFSILFTSDPISSKSVFYLYIYVDFVLNEDLIRFCFKELYMLNRKSLNATLINTVGISINDFNENLSNLDNENFKYRLALERLGENEFIKRVDNLC